MQVNPNLHSNLPTQLPWRDSLTCPAHCLTFSLETVYRWMLCFPPYLPVFYTINLKSQTLMPLLPASRAMLAKSKPILDLRLLKT